MCVRAGNWTCLASHVSCQWYCVILPSSSSSVWHAVVCGAWHDGKRCRGVKGILPMNRNISQLSIRKTGMGKQLVRGGKWSCSYDDTSLSPVWTQIFQHLKISPFNRESCIATTWGCSQNWISFNVCSVAKTFLQLYLQASSLAAFSTQ